jgi:hypothetical protein
MGQSVPNPIIRTSNGLRELSLQELEAMPLSQFYEYKGSIVNAQSAFYYDSTYIKVGVAVPANAKKSLFTLGKNEQDTQFGTSTTTGEKTEFLTNMISNGQFDNGTNFIMEGAGIQCIAPANLPTTVGANGAITAPNYTASVVIDGGNNLQMALNNLELRFIRGEDVKKRGPAIMWPAPPGVGLAGAFGSPNGGFAQNGAAGLVQFTHPVVLEGGDKFQFDLANVAQAAWTPTTELLVRVILWGTKITRQYPG